MTVAAQNQEQLKAAVSDYANEMLKTIRRDAATAGSLDGDGDGIALLALSGMVRNLAEQARAWRKSDGWQSMVDDIVAACPGCESFRIEAALLALRVKYDDGRADAAPDVAGPEVNVAGLALKMAPGRLVAHELTVPAAEVVASTDLHSLPDEPPRLLRGACLVEVAHPERGERLFGDTTGLGCYELEGRRCVVGLQWPTGARVSWWTPQWRGGDIQEGVATDLDDPLVLVPQDGHVQHREWASSAARFLVVLGLLLDASGAPLGVTDVSTRAPWTPRSKKDKPPPAWVTRRVAFTVGAAALPRGTGGAPAAPRGPELEATTVPVRGHLKRQPCGAKGAERKWMFVQGYSARRWGAARPLRVVVKP